MLLSFQKNLRCHIETLKGMHKNIVPKLENKIAEYHSKLTFGILEEREHYALGGFSRHSFMHLAS